MNGAMYRQVNKNPKEQMAACFVQIFLKVSCKSRRAQAINIESRRCMETKDTNVIGHSFFSGKFQPGSKTKKWFRDFFKVIGTNACNW